MPVFRVHFPERVVNPPVKSGSGCCMASCSICTPKDIQRGVTTTTTATDKREAWDKMHRQFPFERIVIE